LAQLSVCLAQTGYDRLIELYRNYFPRIGQHYYITPSVLELITNLRGVATNDMKVYCSVTYHCCNHMSYASRYWQLLIIIIIIIISIVHFSFSDV